MKKLFGITLFFLLSSIILTAQEYRIKQVDYNIQGCGAKIFGQTQDYILAKQLPVNTSKIFSSKAELDKYIQDYQKRLTNLRAFETIMIDYTFEYPQEEDEKQIILTTLKVSLKDSFHLFAIPGPKYDSNTGLTFKLKIKDTNFLGSLNTLSSDIYFMIPTSESDGKRAELGFNANIDYPFKAGVFDALWLNDFGISYTFGEKMPEWNLSTGLRFELPFEKYSLVFQLHQKFINNFAFEDFGDKTYFVNDFKISLPVILTSLNYFGNLLYTPYFITSINWDFDGISKQNSALSSPSITFGHSISFGRTDWSENLRTGFSLSVDNYYTYNFQRQRFYPLIELNTKAYKKISLLDNDYFLKNMGLAANITTFAFMYNPNNSKYANYIANDGKSIGHYLRGIRDTQEYTGTNISSLNPTSALILNLDFPFHIFTTNFSKSFFRYFNFEFQISPFMDIALCYNKITHTFFDLKDGFYSAGVEMIVYPLKWSGITIRASAGLDIGRQLLADKLNMQWRANVAKHEFSLGFGLHY